MRRNKTLNHIIKYHKRHNQKMQNHKVTTSERIGCLGCLGFIILFPLGLLLGILVQQFLINKYVIDTVNIYFSLICGIMLVVVGNYIIYKLVIRQEQKEKEKWETTRAAIEKKKAAIEKRQKAEEEAIRERIKREKIRREAEIREYKRKIRESRIEQIDLMTGIQFEEYLIEMYESIGYKIIHTKASGDFGADIILETPSKRIAVQAKRYKGKVSLSAVQEVSSSIKYYDANEGWVITNSYFTNPAIELADRNNIKLIDRDKLITEIIQSKKHTNLPANNIFNYS